MSLRECGIGLGAILGFAFLLVVSTTGDDKPSAKDAAAGKRVPAGDRSDQENVAKLPQPRVTVRDLRADCAQPPHSDEQWLCSSRHHWGSGYSPDGLCYLSYGRYYGYGWYQSPRWRADAYRALRYQQRKERERRFNRRDMAERKQRLLDQHEQTLAAGLRRLKEGQPARATVALTLAAKLNQGDPACRIYLAQARLAQGHYLEAALALRRALQLQPKLIYTDLHLNRHYATADALGEHTDSLAAWVEKNAARPEVHFLLGFLEFQRGDFKAAHVAFERVRKVMPDDDLTRAYFEITKPPRE